MPRGRYRQKQWDERQAAILDALTQLAATRGFANVTMDELADAVGISKATLYQHFKSKDAMLVALIGAHTERFVAWLAQTTDQPPLERLRAVVRYLMDGHMTPLRGLIQREDLLPILEHHPKLIAQHHEMIAQLNAIITEGQRNGTIAADMAPPVIIRVMWMLSNVPLSEYTALHGDETQLDRETYIAQVLTLFERGLRP
jgi:AcrR family transcriptional regulator